MAAAIFICPESSIFLLDLPAPTAVAVGFWWEGSHIKAKHILKLEQDYTACVRL